MPVRASVIIVTFNSSGVIRACLSSLAPDVQAGLLEVIVVDNASADGTPDLVLRDFPWAVVVAGRENLGYSKGVNVGIREARARYLFILNPDTVVRRGATSKLIEFMETNPSAGIAGPKLVFQDGSVQLSCRRS